MWGGAFFDRYYLQANKAQCKETKTREGCRSSGVARCTVVTLSLPVMNPLPSPPPPQSHLAWDALDRGPARYSLFGVVVHLDSSNSTMFGHYVSYVRNEEGTWFLCDDSHVTEVRLTVNVGGERECDGGGGGVRSG